MRCNWSVVTGDEESFIACYLFYRLLFVLLFLVGELPAFASALGQEVPDAYLCTVMKPTPAELTYLLYSIIFTNPIVESISQAKPRRESNPKLVQRFLRHAAPKSPGYRKAVAIWQIMAFMNPRFVRKMCGSAGVGYIT